MSANPANPLGATPPGIVILGITLTGAPFRPSDWADRLCGVISVFGEEERVSYSPYVKSMFAEGQRCVLVDTRLRTLSPEAFDFLMGFARDNELRLNPGEDAPQAN